MILIMKKSSEAMGLRAYEADESNSAARKTVSPKTEPDMDLQSVKKQGFFWIYLFGMFLRV